MRSRSARARCSSDTGIHVRASQAAGTLRVVAQDAASKNGKLSLRMAKNKSHSTARKGILSSTAMMCDVSTAASAKGRLSNWRSFPRNLLQTCWWRQDFILGT